MRLELDLELDLDEHSVAGSATNHLRALVDDTRCVRFHAAGLAVEEVRDRAGRRLEFRLHDSVLEVDLARPLARGEEEALRIRYRARPETGLHFVEGPAEDGGTALQVWSQGQEQDNRHWFPTWDQPNDRFHYAGRYRVGGELQVVSNGRLVRVEQHDDGERSFHWEMERSLTAYLVAIAAGRWERYADSWRGVPVEYYVAPGTGEEAARRAFGETPAMLEFFTQLLGVPYPYEKYAQVAVAEFENLGMENTSVTIQNDYVIVDEDAALDLDGDPRLLVAHELAHQWFGDLVTCLRWSDLWLNEAWASYLELRFERHVAGEESFRAWLERYRVAYLAQGAGVELPLCEDWRAQVSEERAHNVYDKGPWVLHMLCTELGEAAFWQAAHDYLVRHAEGLVTTADFWRAIFDSTGRNVEGFLEQWVEAAGHPVLGVELDVRSARGGSGALWLEIRQEQTLSELVPLFELTVWVELYFADGRTERHALAVRDLRQDFELPLAGPLVDLVVDADCALLCELRVEKPVAMWAHQAHLPHAGLRWRALEALARVERPRSAVRSARREHERLLRTDPQDQVRALAAALWRDRGAQAVLLEAVTSDPSPRVRLAAASALRAEELGRDGRRVLEAHLGAERSPAVRETIEELLAAGSE